MRHGLRDWKTGAARDERLSLWVQMAIEAAWDGMLTLWIGRVYSTWQLTKRIGNRALLTPNYWASRLLIRRLIRILLLPLLGRERWGLNGRAICGDWGAMWLESRLILGWKWLIVVSNHDRLCSNMRLTCGILL